jgi:hypothetical protein
MEGTITQAIIAGIFTIIGIWYKQWLEDNRKNGGSKPAKVYVAPKEQMKKGLKRVGLSLFLILLSESIFDKGEQPPIETFFGLIILSILFYGIWLTLKGVFRMIFS